MNKFRLIQQLCEEAASVEITEAETTDNAKAQGKKELAERTLKEVYELT